ncbi:hypothetical protein AUP68_03287 [Ilyonectria robusta]
MKFSAITVFGFLAAGAIAGGDDYKKSNKCSKIIWEPARCKPIPYGDKRDVEEREAEAEADYGDYSYPSKVCHMKCPDKKAKCTKYGWDYSYARYEGSFDVSVDCKKGGDYKVTGVVGPCEPGSKDDCLTVTYKGGYWPSDKKISYLGIYPSPSGPKSLKKLNANAYCFGDKCTIPFSEIGDHGDLCGDKYYIAIDAGRCPSEPYGQKSADKISFVKLEIECIGKKTCQSWCCKTDY